MRVVSFGEALWDMLPGGPVLGGAPLNFAFRISTLGHDSHMISALGLDELGDRAFEAIKALGLDRSAIQRISGVPTGTVDVSYDKDNNPDYVINAPAAYDRIQPDDGLIDLVKTADCICFGSLVQRTPECRNTLDVLLRSYGGSHILYDVNLRKDCYTRDIVDTSLKRATIAKLNHEELEELSSMLGTGGTAIPDRTQALLERYGLDHCLVTLGKDGAFAASSDGELVYTPAFYVKRADPVGAGDAFTAGFLHGLLAEGGLHRACELGNALGSLVTGLSGATGAVSRDEIDEIIRSDRFEHIREDLTAYR